MNSRPLLVVGMHRSGTSAVARAANLLGVHLGADDRLLPANEFNPAGFWELRSIVHLDEELLRRLGGSWREPPELPPGWERARELDELRSRARAVVDDELATAATWGFKDPRAALTAPFWETVLGEPSYVLCVRNPLDVARSLEERDGVVDGGALWLRYTAAMLANSSGRRRILVDYEALLAEPERELRRLARFLGCEAEVDRPEVRAALADAVRPDLRHHRATLSAALDDDRLPPAAKVLYTALRTGGEEIDEAADVLALRALEGARALRGGATQSGEADRVRCSVVIPVWNRADLTRECLQAILPAPPEVEVIVVDDGSTDETSELLESYGDAIRVVTHERSQGFAVACNDAARIAEGAYVVFLNNDTIPTRGWLDALRAYAERHPQAAVVGAKLLYPDDTVQHAGVVVCSDRSPRHLYAGFPGDHPAVSVSRRFQAVTFACALVRRRAFEEAAGFDTAYVNGHEDVDLCLRLGELGYEVHYCAESVVYHLESASRDRDDSANHRLYRQRWGERVVPDEFRYYVDDGLVEIDYSASYPLRIRIAPALGSLAERRTPDDPSLGELLDAVRRIEAAVVTNGDVEPTAPSAYEEMVERIRAVVPQALPRAARALVVSRGDERLLGLDGLVAGHFPQDSAGQYAGWYPATGADAVADLERLRAQGAEYLVLPSTGRWWLDHYRELRAFLETQGSLVLDDPACAVYRLRSAARVVAGTSYGSLVRRVLQTVDALVPEDAGVVVASKGDDALLDLGGRRAAHVPRDAYGRYAGHHPDDGAEAVAQLERACADGYRYFVLPEPISWWRDYYPELREALETRWRQVAHRPGVCAVFDLGAATPRLPEPEYGRLVDDVRGILAAVVPPGAVVAVASRGDGDLLAVPRRTLRHFPAGEDGAYAGYYPADDTEAVAWLERERARGVEFVAFPATAHWWLDFYPALGALLAERAAVVWSDDRCTVYDVRRVTPDEPSPAGAARRGVLDPLRSLVPRREPAGAERR